MPLLMGIIVGLVMLATRFFPDKPSDSPSDPAADFATPSPWIESVMQIYTLAYPTLYAAAITSLALRFDYVQEYGVPVRRTTGPVAVPLEVTYDFATPTYSSAVIAQAIGLLALRVLVSVLNADQKTSTIFGMFITVPASMAAALASAKWTGRFSQFWNYVEV